MLGKMKLHLRQQTISPSKKFELPCKNVNCLAFTLLLVRKQFDFCNYFNKTIKVKTQSNYLL